MPGPTDARHAVPQRRSRRRRWVFAAVLVVLLVVVAEILAALGWWWLTGSFFTWGRAAALRAEAGGAPVAAAAGDPGAGEARARDAVVAGVAQHPFLGFVVDRDRDGRMATTKTFPVSSFGFVDDREPLRRRAPDRWIVGLVGGSVALQLGLLGQDALAAELAKCDALRGRAIEFVRLGVGGYKQPQQLFAVEYLLALGGEFDCIVALDGFNEVALVSENTNVGVPAFYPRSWARLLDDRPSVAVQMDLGRLALLRAERTAAVESAESLWWSPGAQLWWLVGDRRRSAAIHDVEIRVERAGTTASYAVTGPGLRGLDEHAARAEMVDVWRRASQDLDAVCRGRGIAYFHFLQPNQYVPDGKPMGAEERARAVAESHPFAAAVRDGYPMLAAAGAALVRAGVAFTDLTRLFATRSEPLYVDTCCHLNRAGVEAIAQRIGAVVRRTLDGGDVALVALRVEPSPLRLDDPLQAPVLRVLGRTQDGRELDVTDPAFGTEIRADDAGRVDVRDGRVRALARGEASLRVRHGDLVATVAVAADWPDVVVGSDAVAAAPRLALAHPFAAGATAIEVRVDGLPEGPDGGHRIVQASALPIPPALPEDEYELRGRLSIPLVGTGGSAVATVPLAQGNAARDRPVFVRALVVSSDGRRLLAASNSVVVTPR